ncbi:MAG: hypothetical protein C0404_02115 [Verrucomicrobia bacterium]|nr:hypothetical protein [Verrucomicrobiota bacterium]
MEDNVEKSNTGYEMRHVRAGSSVAGAKRSLRRSCAVAFAGALFSVLAAGRAAAMHASDDPALEVTEKNPFGIAVSVRCTAGVVDGRAEEIIYGATSKGAAVTQSRLTWDIKDITLAGAIVSALVDNDFNVNLGLWKTMSRGSGRLDNYDWVEDYGYGADQWAFRSLHDVFVESSYMFDLNGSMKLYGGGDNSTMCLVLGFKRDEWKWTDSVRELTRSDNSFRDFTTVVDGRRGIDYRQVYEIPYAGFSGRLNIGSVSFSGYVVGSFLVKAEDDDLHLWKNDHFTSSFSGGKYIAAGVAGQWNITGQLFVSAAWEYQRVPEFSGDIALVEGGTGYIYTAEGAAGISHKSSMYSAALGWRF